MSLFPIRAGGLGAIIRDTSANRLLPDSAEIDSLKAKIDEMERSGSVVIDDAAKQASEAAEQRATEKFRVERETIIAETNEQLQRKSREVDELEARLDATLKTLDEEIPQGTARELLIDAHRVEALRHDRAGNLLDAFHLYRRIVRLDPQDVSALYQVAIIYYSAGLRGKAVQTLRAIVEIDPDNVQASENLEALLEEEITDIE